MSREVFYFISQGIGIAVLIIALWTMVLKNMTLIVIGQLLVNLLAAANFLFADSAAGVGVNIVGAVQTFTIFIFQKRGKKLPAWLIPVFIAAYIVCSFLTFKVFMDILPVLAAIAFCLSVLQKKSAFYRFFSILNCALWLAYDIYTKSYALSLTHIILLVVTAVSAIVLDREEWRELFRGKRAEKKE